MSDGRALVIRGTTISEDSLGNICLDDLWRLSGAKDAKAPKHWRTTRAAISLIEELQKKVTSADLKANKPYKQSFTQNVAAATRVLSPTRS